MQMNLCFKLLNASECFWYKLDVEDECVAWSAAEKLGTEGDNDMPPRLKKSTKLKLKKPQCVQLLESVSDSAYFTGR